MLAAAMKGGAPLPGPVAGPGMPPPGPGAPPPPGPGGGPPMPPGPPGGMPGPAGSPQIMPADQGRMILQQLGIDITGAPIIMAAMAAVIQEMLQSAPVNPGPPPGAM